jgi:26S proteasome regulatory subunit N2
MTGISSGTAVATSTASSSIALLKENNETLQGYALTQLLAVVDSHWHQIAESLVLLEAMAEESVHKKLAAAVASRVFFYLREPDQALKLALVAGDEYVPTTATANNNNHHPYVDCLVAAAMDAYVQARRTNDDPLAEELRPMVRRLVDASCQMRRFHPALGLALEARDMEQVASVLKASGPSHELLLYALDISVKQLDTTQRVQVLQLLADGWQQQLQAGHVAAAYHVVQVYHWMKRPDAVASVLERLVSTDEGYLWALQICLDLVDTGNQPFVKQVSNALLSTAAHSTQLDQINRILVGGWYSELALSFLHKESKADRWIMENLKKALDERSSGSRSSLLHHAAVMTHSYLYAGTTNDSFLRDYLEWMKKASNWYVTCGQLFCCSFAALLLNKILLCNIQGQVLSNSIAWSYPFDARS